MKIENLIFDFHGKFLIRCSAFALPNPDKQGLQPYFRIYSL